MKKAFFVLFSLMVTVLGYSQEKPEGLFINSHAPDFKAKDQNGKEISLRELKKKGNVVLVFYRGNWCPYCNKYLRKLQDSLQLITQRKAQLVAITSEASEGIDSTIKKTGAQFSILYDQGMRIAQNYKVAYLVDDITKSRYKTAGIDLLSINHQQEVSLPVPAVYIVNKEGSIIFRYFENDYKKRLPVREILKALD
ncbi:MAG: hypothetical protein NVSMB67_27050 [Flavisolibacter sp.]